MVARLEEKVERQQAQLFQHQQLFDQLDPTGLLKGANLNGLHLPQWQRERLDDILAEVVTQQKRLTTDQEMQARYRPRRKPIILREGHTEESHEVSSGAVTNTNSSKH